MDLEEKMGPSWAISTKYPSGDFRLGKPLEFLDANRSSSELGGGHRVVVVHEGVVVGTQGTL